MSFMQKEIYFGSYYEVAANHGETHIVPIDVSGHVQTYGELSDYVEGKIDSPEDTTDICNGWLARMQAPGYLDCTDWAAFSTEAEADAYLDEMYGDDEGEDSDV